MDKPWDVLRKQIARPPICRGYWVTSHSGAGVSLNCCGSVAVDIDISGQSFRAKDLRELAEFCTELADQLEGK